MGLNSSFQKIIEFTQKFSNTLNPDNLINIKIPGGAVSELLGFEEGEDISSVADLKDAVEDAGALVATGANIIKCAWTMTKSQWGDFLGQMSMGVLSVIAALTDEIIEVIALQINMAIDQVVNTITNIVSALHNLWNSMKMIWQSLKNLWNSWKKELNTNMQLELDQANCKDMFAAIAGCFLNKYLGPYIDEFKEKTINAINEVGNDFNSLLYDELKDANVFAAYANQEAFLLKKASLQMNGLTRQNLFGG